jgi:hypothetical protein
VRPVQDGNRAGSAERGEGNLAGEPFDVCPAGGSDCRVQTVPDGIRASCHCRLHCHFAWRLLHKGVRNALEPNEWETYRDSSTPTRFSSHLRAIFGRPEHGSSHHRSTHRICGWFVQQPPWKAKAEATTDTAVAPRAPRWDLENNLDAEHTLRGLVAKTHPELYALLDWDSDADELIATATDRKTLNALAQFIDEHVAGR